MDSGTVSVFCQNCGVVINPERLEALPETKVCKECSAKGPQLNWFDPNVVCAQASPSGQNGWSSKS